MFSQVTSTWNPVGGLCGYRCLYCWSTGRKGLVKRFNMKKYTGEPYIYRSEFEREWKPGEMVFVCDMLDLFCSNVTNEIILEVLEHLKMFPAVKFLLLTKNPRRYISVIDHVPENCVLGATVESNWNYPALSHAPLQSDRLEYLQVLRAKTDLPIFISIEPVLEFDDLFAEDLLKLNPWGVAVGYDGYNYHLPEPKLDDTLGLISSLEKNKVKVFEKTIRKAWNECGVYFRV